MISEGASTVQPAKKLSINNSSDGPPAQHNCLTVLSKQQEKRAYKTGWGPERKRIPAMGYKCHSDSIFFWITDFISNRRQNLTGFTYLLHAVMSYQLKAVPLKKTA